MEVPVLTMRPGPLFGTGSEYVKSPGTVKTVGPGICSQHLQGLHKVHFHPLTKESAFPGAAATPQVSPSHSQVLQIVPALIQPLRLGGSKKADRCRGTRSKPKANLSLFREHGRITETNLNWETQIHVPKEIARWSHLRTCFCCSIVGRPRNQSCTQQAGLQVLGRPPGSRGLYGEAGQNV